MKIDNLKELEAVLKVCRKHGVRSIEISGIKMAIEVQEAEDTHKQKTEEASTQPRQYTDEEILFFSSTPPEL